MWIVAVVLALAMVTSAAPAAASGSAGLAGGAAGRLPLAPCHLPNLKEEVLCTSLEVPEDRSHLDGRKIQLRIGILPARSPKREPDPLFLLAGGPGQGAASYAGLADRAFRKIRLHRDIVLVDQRGTGESNPLRCDIGGDDLAHLSSVMGTPEQFASCLEHLDADVRLYTSFQAMEDLDEVRQALGYERINLWGGSYGTRSALVYMKLHPERVRTVILDGVAAFALKFPLYTAREAQRSLDLLFDQCASEPDCAAAFPRFRDEVREILARLEKAPARTEVRHPRSGAVKSIEVTRSGFASTLRGFLYTPSHRSLTPLVVHEAWQGNFEPLVALADAVAAWSVDTMSLGMTLSVLCSEDLPRISPSEAAAATKDTFVGTAEIEAWSRACSHWPRGVLPDGFDAPLHLPVPALILSGALDPVTPPVWGDEAARQLPGSLHVAAPGAAHNVSFSGCVPDLITRVIESGAVTSIDAGCAGDVRTPPFVITRLGTTP